MIFHISIQDYIHVLAKKMDNPNDNLRDIIPKWFCFLPNKLEYTDHLCSEDHGDREKFQDIKENSQYKAKYYCLDCTKGCLCMICFEVGNPHHTHKKIQIQKSSERPSIKALTTNGHLIQTLVEPFYKALHELSTYSWNHHLHYFLAPPRECKQAKINICHTCQRKETSGIQFKYCSIKCLVDSTLPIRPQESTFVNYEIARKSNLKKKLKKRLHEDVFHSQIYQTKSPHVDDFQKIKKLRSNKIDYITNNYLSMNEGTSDKLLKRELKSTINIGDQDEMDKYLKTMHALLCKMKEYIEVHGEVQKQHEYGVFPLDAKNETKKDLKECTAFKNFTKALKYCKKTHELKQHQQLAFPSKPTCLDVATEMPHTNNQDKIFLPLENQVNSKNVRILNAIHTLNSIFSRVLPENNMKNIPSDIQYELKKISRSKLQFKKVKPKE